MKIRTPIFVIAIPTLVIQATTVGLAAQEHNTKHHHYKLIDVGTFGGPQSYLFSPGVVRSGLLNNQGKLTGSADTSAVDSFCYWAPDCYATNAFLRENGGKTDLGVLPGGIGSAVNWISGNGLMAGIADNGQQDPLNLALPQIRAVVWQGGTMTDLGNFFGSVIEIFQQLRRTLLFELGYLSLEFHQSFKNA